MLHNDRQQDILWQMQQEKRQPARGVRIDTAVPTPQLPVQRLRNRLYWRGGELLIAAGTNLKCQVSPQYCG